MFITNMKFIYKFQLYIFSICFYSTQKGVTLSLLANNTFYLVIQSNKSFHNKSYFSHSTNAGDPQCGEQSEVNTADFPFPYSPIAINGSSQFFTNVFASDFVIVLLYPSKYGHSPSSPETASCSSINSGTSPCGASTRSSISNISTGKTSAISVCPYLAVPSIQ